MAALKFEFLCVLCGFSFAYFAIKSFSRTASKFDRADISQRYLLAEFA
jgi:hypothetical protein